MAQFVFDSYTLASDRRTLVLRYLLGDEQYEEVIGFPTAFSNSLSADDLHPFFFNLHLAAGISYWKAECYPTIKVASGTLTKSQAQFWNTVYTKGLGEFYFRNSFDFRNAVSFPHAEGVEKKPLTVATTQTELVGFGGGKDSVVVWEILKQKGISAHGLIIETQHRYESLINLMSMIRVEPHRVERKIDTSFLAKKWTYNGHVPISMIYAWIGVTTCFLYGYNAFVVANEKSANQGNTEYLGMQINHQWSKTEEFEKLFSEYLKMYVTPDIRYYSPIRQMSELDVVREAVKHPEYLPHITSCNRNFSIGNALEGKRWCGECPKCAFAFLLFAACLPKSQVIQMFGKDMLADRNLVQLFRDLGGRGGLKPFECVGTFEEVQESLRLIQQKGELSIPEELL